VDTEETTENGVKATSIDDETPQIEPDDATSRPNNVPDKFWDQESGKLRTESLLKSYNELENKLGNPSNIVPEDSDGYELMLDHPSIDIDPEVNARLHAAGFSQSQAQLVYDLAKEKLLPIIQGMTDNLAQDTDKSRLEEHFGGKDKWREISRQLGNWGRSNLTDNVFGSLITSYDGIIALHQMMSSSEPPMLGGGGQSSSGMTEDDLKQLMRDPRYWRDHDPAIVSHIQKGFEALYPG